jgi:hypothetical protein
MWSKHIMKARVARARQYLNKMKTYSLHYIQLRKEWLKYEEKFRYSPYGEKNKSLNSHVGTQQHTTFKIIWTVVHKSFSRK